jgi:hypothetical protein
MSCPIEKNVFNSDNYFMRNFNQSCLFLLAGLASVASAETTGREKVQVGREQ